MNSYQEIVKVAIQATIFHSPTTFSWLGHQSERIHSHIQKRLTPTLAHNYLHFNLKFRLYSSLYSRGLPTPANLEKNFLIPQRNTPFIEQLSAANAGQGYWRNDPDIRWLDNHQAMIKIHGLEMRIPQEALSDSSDLLRSGEPLRIKLPKEYLGMSPGFYMAISDQGLMEEEGDQLVRVYWHLMAEGAIPLMASLTTQLNQMGIPFQFKVINDPARYTRCDAAVLYFQQSHYRSVSEILEKIYPDIAAYLRPTTPVFTKVLAPGIGLAEDPGNGDSFGLNRCGILADGLIRAYEAGVKSVEEKLQIVENQFIEAGLRLTTPYLNSQSQDCYPILHIHTPNPTVVVSFDRHQQSNPAAYLQTAVGIGRRLCKSAIWHGDRCTWMGAEPEQNWGSPLSGPAWITLGPDLYAGTSGVALFLAELYAISKVATFRQTALGAMRQALTKVELCPPPFRLGFYSGWIGIAFAAARLSVLLNEPDLAESARQLVDRTIAEAALGEQFDLISGVAGALSGILAIQSILKAEGKQSHWHDFALRLGNRLVQTAQPEKVGCSWKSGKSHPKGLTGFSHGTAGVAYALLELFQVTRDPLYQQTAEQALDYERYCFDATVANWPDLREDPTQGTRRKKSRSFMTTWCHGAAGIALSRLRAYELFAEDSYRSEAITAVNTTSEVIEQWLDSGSANYSLCHGLAGNAESLLYSSQVLGHDQDHATQLVHRLAMSGIERYGSDYERWPGGVKGGESPSLMLGLAGIGHFYLRLYAPTIPSLLMVKPESFSSDLTRSSEGNPRLEQFAS
ncbi:MAG: lanthionine synthetase LanC family protein [Cyanophyceae cyanobacterium]